MLRSQLLARPQGLDALGLEWIAVHCERISLLPLLFIVPNPVISVHGTLLVSTGADGSVLLKPDKAVYNNQMN